MASHEISGFTATPPIFSTSDGMVYKPTKLTGAASCGVSLPSSNVG